MSRPHPAHSAQATPTHSAQATPTHSAQIPIRRRVAAIILATATLAFTAVACGDSTAESEEVSSAASSSAAETTTSASESTSSTSTRSSSQPAGEPDITDPGATRVSEAPDGQMPLSKDDGAYLDALIAADIDVAGVEDQLIGAGRAICAEVPEAEKEAMATAMAGQLRAQERTKVATDKVADAIASSAQKAYC